MEDVEENGEYDQHSISVYRTLTKYNDFVDKWATKIHDQATSRCSMDEWLDENEREWMMLDSLCRSRTWAINRDKPFPYPFRKATQDMRDVGDVGWIGDDKKKKRQDKPCLRSKAPSEVITCLRLVPIYPPATRLLLFTPEFGSEGSFNAAEWDRLAPRDSCDIWVISWQGWSNFDTMMEEVFRKVMSFADGVSTVWFGHSMGAIVAYECLRRMLKRETPNLPVALAVSGCPAPHLLSSRYKPETKYPWLQKMLSGGGESLTEESIEVLEREFAVQLDHEYEFSGAADFVKTGNALPAYLASKVATRATCSKDQRTVIAGDLRVMRSYKFEDNDDTKITLPILIFRSDEDDLVPEEGAVDAWAEYTTESAEVVALEDHVDGDVLSKLGHGYAKCPPTAMLEKLQEISTRHQIHRDMRHCPEIGETTGSLPDEVDILIVGAGITGITAGRSFAQTGQEDFLIVDKYPKIGGIWEFYANQYSRVNTSEVGYRIMDQTGKNARVNEDHSPTHDIMRDIYTVAADYCKGKIRCSWAVTKTEKQADGTYKVWHKSEIDGSEAVVKARVVVMATNRRIGRRRDIEWPGEKKFRGEIVYGYANENTKIDFWGKKVMVVGAGAFAFENLRTALEHGAKHATILGRRAGTTCPKWIDVIAFMRGKDDAHNTHKGGNVISFEVWQNLYHDANLPTPDCWAEGLLKPPNHTVSVSDLAFIGGYHGLVSLDVGAIKCFRDDGQGVTLECGRDVDVDVIIKCTGFHLNDEVPQIVGTENMHPISMIDFNMSYIAETLLDGGQFGNSKGNAASSADVDALDKVLKDNQAKIMGMPPDILRTLAPRGNPFGSGYIIMGMANADYAAWMAKNEREQAQLLESMGTPKLSSVKFWASQVGSGFTNVAKLLISRIIQPRLKESDAALPVAEVATAG